jgi:DNA-binding winged helix-turn-helix (wHTH) protein
MVRLSDPPAIIEFGHFSILPHRRQLLAEGRPVRLGGRAFDLLLALIEAPGAVVGKDELLSRIWPGRIVEENRRQNEIWALRKAFGADRELIRTVSGRGYQFAGEIREAGVGVGARQVPASLAVPAPPRPMTNLSESISELIGREAALSEVTDLVTGLRKSVISFRNMVYSRRSWFARLTRRRSSNLATSASCRIAANCSPKAGR